ncbi:unnamed protein product [Somion occarium]|uniref:GATA-type domain-containing protein n=1 Tax=Somion occarium TaxID=3059160 RepID=A0ABP1EC47_9APHY
MTSAHHPQASGYPVAHNQSSQRLPSLRHLDFYPGSGPTQPTLTGPTEYAPPPAHLTREEATSWTRPTSSPSVPVFQQPTPVATRPPELQKPHYSSHPSNSYASPHPPPTSLSTQSRTASSGAQHTSNGRGEVAPQSAPKRTHSSSSVSETPGRSPQTAYPPHAQYAVQSPPYHPTVAPPPESMHHPSAYSQPPVGYSQYQPPQQMSQRPYHPQPLPPVRSHQSPTTHQPTHQSAHQSPSMHQLPPPHHPSASYQQQSPVHQAPAPTNHPPPAGRPTAHHQPLAAHHSQQPHHSQPPHHSPPSHQPSHQSVAPTQAVQPSHSSYPPQPEHWSHHQPLTPAQPQAPLPHQTYESLSRNVPPIATLVDPRNVAASIDPDKLASRQGTISKIVEHCNALYSFASRYANSPNMQPSPSELHEMAQRASTVVRLLEDLRRLDLPADQPPKEESSHNGISDEHRPPKRPWEDMSRDDEATPPVSNYRPDHVDEKAQSTAEADMEIIRSKRATSSAANVPGQPKSKYRKRSRATPPGKCHSCNIRETPEWRRGPDGARTLCNACGLHYAKLMRKRDKAGLGPDGKPANITIESLRASTASARGAEHGEAPSQAPSSHHHMPPPPSHPTQGPPPQSPYPEHAPMKQLPPPMHPSHHASQHPHPQPQPGSYHLMPPPPAPPLSGQHPHHHMMPPPPPPTGHAESGPNVAARPWLSPSGRGGYDQSYMRPSNPASHARSSPH